MRLMPTKLFRGNDSSWKSLPPCPIQSIQGLPMTDPFCRSPLPPARLLCLLLILTSMVMLPASGAAADQPMSIPAGGLCLLKGEEAGRIAPLARAASPVPRELGVGEWRILPEVCPRETFFPTSVLVTPGATYRISAAGLWRDLWITVGPEGWWFPPLHPFNRLPWRRMFVLSGSVGPSRKHTFVIGRLTTWTVPQDLPPGSAEQLMLFPNDWESKYDNNRALSSSRGGPMRVSIERLR